MRKIYTTEVDCTNCRVFPVLGIGKGTTVKQHLTKAENKECPNCGIKALKEINYK